MRVLDVLQSGGCVPDAGTARVFSLHDRVINLELPAAGSAATSSVLLSLVLEGGDMSDLAMQVPALPGELEPGSVVAWGDVTASEGFAGERDGARIRLRLETGRGKRWSGLLAGDVKVPRAVSTRREVRETIRRALREEGAPSSFRGLVLGRNENAFVARARAVLEAAVPATESRLSPVAVPPFAALLEGLCGLGVGFTPSGDDFVAGLLLAAAMTDGPWYRRSPDGVFGEAEAAEARIRRTLGTTTAGGRTLLRLALQGRFPAYLLAVAAAVTAPAPGKLERALHVAFRHGATSGQDAMSGFLWYLDHLDSLTAS